MQQVHPALNKVKVRVEGVHSEARAHSKKSSSSAILLEAGGASNAHRAITPPSHPDCGAQISGQCPPAAMQAGSAVLPASTASSCQPSGSAGAAGQPRQQSGAASSCARAQKGTATAAAQSPPASTKGSGRRRAASASASAGRKRVADDPLQKAIARYMEAKSRKVESGDDTPPSAQPLRASKRPRTATGLKSGTTKSGTTTSNTSGSALSAGAGPSFRPAPRSTATLAQGITSLALASPAKQQPGAAAAAAAGKEDARAGPAGARGGGQGDPRLEGLAGLSGEELTGAMQGLIQAEGAAAAAAMFAPLATLQQQYTTLQEQLEAGVGPELSSCLAEALALGQGNPWGAMPGPLPALTEEELAEARRQLKATAKPFPPEYKWVSPMPLSEEAWGPLMGTTARAGGSSSAVSGAAAGAGAAGGKSSGKSGKAQVAPYRLPVPVQPGSVRKGATTGAGSGAAAAAGGGGRGRYSLRTGRGKRKKDSGYVSFDSDDCTTEEEYEEMGDDEDVEMEGLTDADPSDSELEPSQRSVAHSGAAARAAARGVAAAPTPASAATQQPQPKARWAGATGAPPPPTVAKQPRAGSAASAKPPHAATPAPTAAPVPQTAPTAVVMAAAAPAPAPGSKLRKTSSLPALGTPKVPTLGMPNILSPLLSPTLASLFLPDQMLPGVPAAGQTIDLNADLEHFLGDLDFSNDAVIAMPLPARPASSLQQPGSAGMQAALEVAAAFSGSAKNVSPLSATPVVGASGGGWLAAAGLAAAANLAANGGVGGSGLLNPPLPPPSLPKAAALTMAPLPPAAAVARAASAPAPALSNSLGMAPAPAAYRPASAGAQPPLALAGAVPVMLGSAASAAFHVGAEQCEDADAGALAALVADPSKDRLDLLHAMGGGLGGAPGHRTPLLGSPLLQGLMSPTALGALLDGW